MSLRQVGLVTLVCVTAGVGLMFLAAEQGHEELEDPEYAGVQMGLVAKQGDEDAGTAEYPGTEVFSIPYGSEPSQVGFAVGVGAEGFESAGPGHMKVDRYGNVWLLTGSQVKAFRGDGTLLRVVGRVTRDDTDHAQDERSPLEYLEYVRTYAVDGRGYVYLLADRPLTHLWVIDQSNKLMVSERDEYGELVQVRGEERIIWELQREVGHELARRCIGDLAGPLFVCTDEADNLYLQGPAEEQIKERSGTEVCYYKLDPNLEFVGTVPGYYVGPDGYTYEFADGNTPENVRLHTYDRDGQRVRTTQLVRPEGPWPSCDTPVFDWSHNIYMCCPSKRQEPLLVMPGFEIRRDYVVYKYTPDGQLLTKFRIPYPPVVRSYAPSPIAVDREENVYYLDFGASELRVMMVPTK